MRYISVENQLEEFELERQEGDDLSRYYIIALLVVFSFFFASEILMDYSVRAMSGEKEKAPQTELAPVELPSEPRVSPDSLHFLG